MNKRKWEQAIQDELKSLHDNSTWSLVNRLNNANIIGYRRTFCVKTDCELNKRFKARRNTEQIILIPLHQLQR